MMVRQAVQDERQSGWRVLLDKHSRRHPGMARDIPDSAPPVRRSTLSATSSRQASLTPAEPSQMNRGPATTRFIRTATTNTQVKGCSRMSTNGEPDDAAYKPCPRH